MMRTSLIIIAVLIFGSAGAQTDSEVVGQKYQVNSEAAKANPFLREALAVNCPYGLSSTGSRTAEGMFREEWIDKQIDHFVREIDGKANHIFLLIEAADQARAEAAPDTPKGRMARGQWARALKGIEEEAASMHLLLANAIVDLKATNRDKPLVRADADQAAFDEEMRALKNLATKARGKVRDYLFNPTHIADLDDLRGENMLTYLSRTEKLAKAIRSHRFFH